MQPDEHSLYKPEERVTYGNIKEYVKCKYGVNVHTRHVAEVKRMCGLEMRELYHKSKKDDPQVKHCPPEKIEYIKEALRHFGVLA